MHHLEGVEALGECGAEELEAETAPILDALCAGLGAARPTIQRGRHGAPSLTRLAACATLPVVRRIWREEIERIVPYQAGPSLETLERLHGPLVRLSSNENPLGPSPHVVDVVAREASRVHLYPDGGSTAVREALAGELGVGPEQLVVANGADELLQLIGLAAFDPGDEIVVPEPSFEPYTIVAQIAHATVVASPLLGYHTSLEDVRRRINARTKAIMLCSPHNPATTIIPRGPMMALLDAVGDDPPLIVLDEAYGDFADDPDYPDGIALLKRYPRLLILRTFSKIAGLAGLRVGYAIGSAETIDRLNRVRAPYNVNRLGQVAAVAAIEDREHREKTRRLVIEERAFLMRELARRGFLFPPSQANFLLVKVPDAAATRDAMAKAGILVRDGGAVGFPGHLRISIGLRETNERLLKVLDFSRL
ncbi:MAG: histidinol-phosphate transaminase [Candidatus Rokubacteria bacterium]|nr:histidinol-phosphate transaminase [Candidatus Rokubacteria bacterium]